MKTITTVLALTLAAVSASNAATVLFDVVGKAGTGLLAGNENGAINGTPGSGGEISAGVSYDDVSNLLTINVGWGSGNGFLDLTGNATAAHIHGPTTSGGVGSFTQNAGVLFNLDASTGYTRVNSSSTGSIIGSNTLRVITELEEADLLAGKWYINVHTSLNSPGEIRGNLVVVPEPGTMALAAMGLGVLGLAARRRMAR